MEEELPNLQVTNIPLPEGDDKPYPIHNPASTQDRPNMEQLHNINYLPSHQAPALTAPDDKSHD
jgi:hypothetical protein